MHDTGRMRICPGGDALTGLSTPFTKFAWCLILQQRCGIFKGGQLASSLIKAVSSKRRQEHSRVDLVANLFRQHHGIVLNAPDHGCQPEGDKEKRMSEAPCSTNPNIAETKEDAPTRTTCDLCCGDTDEEACRHCGITFCAECQRHGFRYFFDCMCGERLLSRAKVYCDILPASRSRGSGWQPVG